VTSHASHKQCAAQGCSSKRAKYFMGWPSAFGETVWGVVCARHDRDMGRRNLMDAYGLTKDMAIEFDLSLDRDARAEDRSCNHTVSPTASM
jgi:hypothetical protein